jgi:hypothetical protein
MKKQDAFDERFAHFQTSFFVDFRRVSRHKIPQTSGRNKIHHDDALYFALRRVENVRRDETDNVLVAQVDCRFVENRSFVLKRIFALRKKIFYRNFVATKSAAKDAAETA